VRRQIPNLMTLGCLVLGFSEVGAVLSGHSALAAAFLLWALILDGLAGQVAKRRGGTSELGAELDSLASLMAFGVGVMVMAFERSLRDLGPLGWFVAVAAAVAAALRLSRDTPNKASWQLYNGLPLPACGAAIALLATLDQPPQLVAVAALALSALMLVPLEYPRFSQALPVQIAMGLLLALAAVIPLLRHAVLGIVLLYVLGGPWFDFGGLLARSPLKRKRHG
jgi:phosphatidylserine synthase